MTIRANPDRWLTVRRLRAHALILAVGLWSVYLWTLATPGLHDRNGNLKGTDFLHFYTLGSLAAEHRGADLYNMNEEAAQSAARVPQAAGIRYLPLYPPQVSLLFLALAHLSYGWSLAVWWSINTILYGLCCCKLWQACPNLREYGGLVALAAIAYPAFFHLIAWGQTSALALGCFTVTFFLLRERRNFLAGLFLGCLIFKPQLALAAAVVFVAIGAWAVVAGALISATAQLGLGVLYYGFGPLRQWLATLAKVRSVVPWLEPRPYQTHSLRTFWSMLIAWPGLAMALYLLSTITILVFTVLIWKRATTVPLGLRFAVLLLATALVAPHLTVYDLVILAPAFLLAADWMAGQTEPERPHSFGTLLYMIYVLPLFGPLARWTHVQFSVIAMGAAICVIYARSRQVTSQGVALPAAHGS